MRTGLASAHQPDEADGVDQLVRRFLDDWRRGSADLSALLREAEAGIKDGGDPARAVRLLSALVKADLRCRFERGERPAVVEYLRLYPDLGGHPERVMSLAYEEFCLLEEQGVPTDSQEFCERYQPWTDSLASQLRFHRVLSRVAGVAALPPKFPEPGEVFESYSLVAELGRGGAGRVYLAHEEALGGREVALKVSADRGSEPSILGRLEHPHIVPVHSVFRSPSTKLRGLCMPYRRGLPLDKVIDRVKPAGRPRTALALWKALLAPADEGALRPNPGARPSGRGWEGFPIDGTYVEGVAWVVAVLADALAYAHGHNVLHRDVKPANVLLTYREGPQLLDFNLAHDPEATVDEAEAALRGGTLPYMSPEHLEAFLDPGRWSEVRGPADVYSLGLVLRELLTGRAPDFPDQKLPLTRAIREMLDRRLDFVPDLRLRNPDVPYALEAIAARCLAFSPADRYPNASALSNDLRRFLQHRPPVLVTNPSPRERSTDWLRRNRRVLALLAVGVSVGLALWLGADRFQTKLTDAPYQTGWPNGLPLPDKDVLSLGPRSPVWHVHAASEYARSETYANPEAFQKAFEKAEAEIKNAWALAGAEPALRRWGRSHPRFARFLGSLGADLLNAPLDNRHSRSDWVRIAERPLRLALDLDGKDVVTRMSVATLDECKGHYADAHRTVTELLQLPPFLKGEGPPRGELRQTRARVSVNWAQTLLLDCARKPASLEAASRHLDESFHDLDGLDPSDELYAPFRVEYIRCEATLTQAEVADRQGRDAAAIALYDDAERSLAKLATMQQARSPVFEVLETKVWHRLRNDRPRLELRWLFGHQAQPRAASPPPTDAPTLPSKERSARDRL